MGNTAVKYYITFHWESLPEKDMEILKNLLFFSRDVGFEFARFFTPPPSEDKQFFHCEQTFSIHRHFSTFSEGNEYLENVVKAALRKQSPYLSGVAEYLSKVPLYYSVHTKINGKSEWKAPVLQKLL